MTPSRIRIRFIPSKNPLAPSVSTRSALVALEGQAPILIPEELRAELRTDTWVGRFSLAALRRALAMLPPDPTSTGGIGAVPWHAADEMTLDVDITLPLLLLARDLHDLAMDGEIEIGGA
jgi:hypothetical protein